MFDDAHIYKFTSIYVRMRRAYELLAATVVGVIKEVWHKTIWSAKRPPREW